MSKATKFGSAAVCGICLGIIFLGVRQFVLLYSGSDGFALANNKPYGGDFACFYLAGRAFLYDHALLYDFSAQLTAQHQLFQGRSDVGFLPFVYPPLVAAAFSAFSALDFSTAANFWMIFNLLLFAAAMTMLAKSVSKRGLGLVTVLLVCAAYVPFSIYCIAGGQTSVIGLAIFSGVFYFMRRGRDAAAGAVLALSFYKPPLFLFFLLYFFVDGNRALLKGFFAAAVPIVLLNLFCAGTSAAIGYGNAMMSYRHGMEILPGLRHQPAMGEGILSLLLDDFNGAPGYAYFVFAVLCAVAFYRGMKETRPAMFDREGDGFAAAFAVRLSISVMCSIWLMPYDYTLLLPAYFLFMTRSIKPPFRFECLTWLSLCGLFASYALPETHYQGVLLKPATIFLLLWVISLLNLLPRILAQRVSNHSPA